MHHPTDQIVLTTAFDLVVVVGVGGVCGWVFCLFVGCVFVGDFFFFFFWGDMFGFVLFCCCCFVVVVLFFNYHRLCSVTN